MKYERLTLFLIIITFISCSSSKEIPKEYNSGEKLDLETLNGIYINSPILDSNQIELRNEKDLNFMYRNPSLSNIIFDPYNVFESRYDFQINYEGQIQIKVLNEKEIEFTHIIDDTIIEQATLKGKIDGNFFKIEKKNPTGIPLIWGAFRSKYIYLKLNEKDNLYIIFGASQWGGVLFIFTGNEYIYETKLEFEKINNK